jgi:hypothetical protein
MNCSIALTPERSVDACQADRMKSRFIVPSGIAKDMMIADLRN